ncbi:MAG: helix-turn-helix domain-containing protein [Caulobacter sp.]|nr:helix-turn-helix domain-containing protein [Caulobacter sp.]
MKARHLTPAELSERLCTSVATLAEWRCKGKGPRFLKFGTSKQARVRYPEAEVEAWEAANEHQNTGAFA